MTRPRQPVIMAIIMTLLFHGVSAAAAVHEVGPNAPAIIPVAEVIGGTDVRNNARTNPNGGYFSLLDSANPQKWDTGKGHSNQLGKTEFPNDHSYWDNQPGGCDFTHVPAPAAGGGGVLWYPVPKEWAAYEFTVRTAGTYSVIHRTASGFWPDPILVTMHISIDGISSRTFEMKPDDMKFWTDTHYRTGDNWWGHTFFDGTCPSAWALTPGKHVLKVCIDSCRAADAASHGWTWIHYFKIFDSAKAVSPPEIVLDPVSAHKAAATASAALRQAAEHEQKSRLGQALTAYQRAMANSQPDSEMCNRAKAKIKELRGIGEQRLAAAKSLPVAEAQEVMAQIAKEFAGCDIGVAAEGAAKPQEIVSP